MPLKKIRVLFVYVGGFRNIKKFYLQSSKWYGKNKAKHITYVRNREKKIKNWLKEYKKSLQCEECGENHPACLDFHHINPKEKRFAIGRISDYLCMNRLQDEIAKCCVLCSNCHRKKHWNERNGIIKMVAGE